MRAPPLDRRHWLVLLGLTRIRSSLLAAGQRLIHHWNSDLLLETELTALGEAWITANEDFFVLSRASVEITESDRASWHVDVGGEVDRPSRVPLRDLMDPNLFPRVKLDACLQCAGYGRQFFDPPIRDVPWGRGAIGNASWEGIRLSAVLQAARLRPSVQYVALAGQDATQEAPGPYIKSIPLEKALDPHTMLALRMNGQDLPTAHGGPVRLLVPGWAGTYSLKWLRRIGALAEPWDGYWMSRAFRLPQGSLQPGSSASASETRPITALAVNSMITRPQDGASLKAGGHTLQGFAWSGEAAVTRVEVSTDGGVRWKAAALQPLRPRYAWTRWQVAWHPSPGKYHILARASDSSGAAQPLEPDNWNPGGYGWNAVHSVRVTVV